MYNWIKIYKEHVRSAVSQTKEGSSRVFLTWPGNHFDNSGAVSNAVNSMWKKAGMLGAVPRIGRVSANKFRKEAISATRESKQADDRMNYDLANLMGHKKSTADSYYYLEDKPTSSSRAADALPTIMRTINEDDDENEGADNPENGKHMDTSVKHIEKAADNLPQTPRRHKFTEEEISKIENVFAEKIQAKSISMDTVLTKLKETTY